MATAILLGNIGPTSRSKISAEEIFTGKPVKLNPKDMIQWGRVGMVANKDNIKAKMPSKGTPMMFVGYAMDHPSGTYEMYNPSTKRIITTDSVDFAAFKMWCATEALPQLFEEDEDNVRVQVTSEDLDGDAKKRKAITAENDGNDAGTNSNDGRAGNTVRVQKAFVYKQMLFVFFPMLFIFFPIRSSHNISHLGNKHAICYPSWEQSSGHCWAISHYKYWR